MGARARLLRLGFLHLGLRRFREAVLLDPLRKSGLFFQENILDGLIGQPQPTALYLGEGRLCQLLQVATRSRN